MAKEYSDDIELILIELPKFIKSEHELATIQDKWLYFIKNAGDLDCLPNNLDQTLKKAFTIANEANLSVDELELQHKKRDWIYIQKISIALATKTVLEQGLEKGEAKAKRQKTTGYKCLSSGFGTRADLHNIRPG